MSIYEKRLIEDEARIRTEVINMGRLVAASLRDAIQAMFTGSDKLASHTIISDQLVNRKVRHLNRLCHNFIARHLPSAKHLRFVSSALRLVGELERIGDYVVNISRETLHVTRAPTGLLKREMEMMFNQTHPMLEQALEAFANDNAELARGTMLMADQVQRQLDNAFQDLVKEGDQQLETTRNLLDLYSVFYMLERTSDRAKNICEETLFIVMGETKPEKVFRVLFIDQTNSFHSLMAEAIARKSFPATGSYTSAGLNPAKEANPYMVEQMRRFGMDLSEAKSSSLKDLGGDLSEYDVIVSLDGGVRDYPIKVPFHSATLNWEIDPIPEGFLDTAPEEKRQVLFEQIYRQIALNVNELMERIRGEEMS